MNANRPNGASPVSFPVSVVRLPKKGMPLVIDASRQQLQALAREHDLLAVDAFRADLLVEPWKRNGVKVFGRVVAEITQECVVTLEPLHNRIDEPIDALFLPEDSKLGREGFEEGGEIVLDADGPDSPEIFSGDLIDVGALAEQFFGLAIDPYPRARGAELAAPDPQTGREVAEWQQKLREIARKT